MFRRYSIVALLVAAMLAVAPPAKAEGSEHQQAIVEMLQVTGMIETMNQSFSAVSGQIVQDIQNKKPDLPDDAAQIIADSFVESMQQVTPLIVADAAKLYERYFTTQEIRDITAFYRTPTGQKSIRVLPQLMPEVMKFTQKYVEATVPIALENAKKRLAAKGYEL